MNELRVVTRNVTVRATVQLEVTNKATREEIASQITSYFSSLQDIDRLDHEYGCPWIQIIDNLSITEKENKYRCRKCGNSDKFSEVVWEQRRYPIDGTGGRLSASDAADETGVPVQISCNQCGAIVAQHTTKPPENDTYLQGLPAYWEDLPEEADYFDKQGLYQAVFSALVGSFHANEFDKIVQEYANSSQEVRFAVNRLFTRICGHSLVSIVTKAHDPEP